jgi:hypothetical protein
MTDIRSSQLGTINVLGGVSSSMAVSQLGVIVIGSNPPALGINVSQLGIIVVAQNGQNYQALNPAIQLSCWTPCGVLIWSGH